MDRFDMLTPLGRVAPLAGVTALSAFASTQQGYRIGFTDKEGKVPLLWDFRFIAWVGSWLYNSFAPAFWPGHGLVEYLGNVSITSLVITEGINAGQTGELWGFPLPELPMAKAAPELAAPETEELAAL